MRLWKLCGILAITLTACTTNNALNSVPANSPSASLLPESTDPSVLPDETIAANPRGVRQQSPAVTQPRRRNNPPRRIRRFPAATTPPASPSPETDSSATPSPLAPSPSASASPNNNYVVIDEQQKPRFSIDPRNIFRNSQIPAVRTEFDAPAMLTVLKNTRTYFKNRGGIDPKIQRQGILASQGVTVESVLKTLDFMISTLEEDIKNKTPIRLQDPAFLNANFRAIEWQAYNPQKPSERRIRITKYAVFAHPGSYVRTPQYNVAIYALKDTPESDKLRLKYTKQDILTNIFEPGGREYGQVRALAYLTREGLEEALLEGTIKVDFPDGKSGLYNVDRSNEIPYIVGLPRERQKRYWYFKFVEHIKGYGDALENKIPIEPRVTFAGDVLNIGLGRIVVTEAIQQGKPRLRMGVVADTGGAFLPNLHQLDFLAGIFQNKAEFEAYTRTLPEYVKAYILIKK
jgi:hypothetical protein